MWYLLLLVFSEGFMFQGNVYNGCSYVLMMSMSLSNIAILNVHDVDYCCIIRISKSEAVNLLQNFDVTETSRTV